MGKAEENKQQKRVALLNAALELFTTKGVNRTSIAEISERSGIAKGTFYLYFTDKYDICNKLIYHQSSIMFNKAVDALNARGIPPQRSGLGMVKDTIAFIAEHVINQFCENKALLTFISKNLSWGVFKNALTANTEDSGIDFRRVYYTLIDESGVSFKDPDIMLYMIIELISSTCYSVILYSDPVDIQRLKPYLFNTIHYIIDSQADCGEEI